MRLHWLLTLSLALATCATHAEDVEPARVDNLTVVDTRKVPGQPLEYTFSDGRVLGFNVYQVFFPLITTMKLSANSCNRQLGTTARIVVPHIVRAYFPVWRKHPSRTGGLALSWESDDKKFVTGVETTNLARTTNLKLDGYLNRSMDISVGTEKEFKHTVLAKNSIAWMECDSECQKSLPPNAKIQFWDENFETSNREVAMPMRNNDSPSQTQMTNRLQEVGILRTAKTVELLPPSKIYGVFAQIFPILISYQLQWTFVGQNIFEADEQLCTQVWDVDFASVFTQFTQFSQQLDDPAKAPIQKTTPYLYDPADNVNGFNDVMDADAWVNKSFKP